ncbi:class I SAM-dependent methyltransferase [Neobacillus mesonae]|nr:class I SAM-dependent methyltransferase [Neobacillus mesonae]
MKEIIDYYSAFDEWGRLDREPLEFIVNWHYIQKHLPRAGRVLDNGAGPGKYAMEMAKQGYQVTLSDLTPRLVSIAEEQAVNLQLESQFEGFHVLNATDLHLFSDETFDASLMLGPLYHLQAESDRSRAAKELYRVTKSGGIVFVAFQTRSRMLLNSLLNPQHWKPNHTMEALAEFRQSGIFNHKDGGRFTGAYYFETAAIEPFMKEHGFEKISLMGSTNMGALLSAEQMDYWRNQGEEAYREFIDLMISTAADPSVLGISSHLLYIGRRL